MENSLDLRKKRLKTQVKIETFVIKRKKVQDPGYSSMAVTNELNLLTLIYQNYEDANFS